MRGFIKFTVSNIKMFLREREAVFFTFLFPIILMGLLGLAFGKAQDVNFNIGIVDKDNSIFSENFTEIIKNVSYFNVKELKENEANDTLKKGDLDIVILIPKNFGNRTNETIGIYYYNLYSQKNLTINSTAIYIFYSNSYQGKSESAIAVVNAIITLMNKKMTNSTDIISIQSESVSTIKFEFIDWMMPGIIAMSVMQTAIYSMSIFFVQAREKGIMRRLRITPLTSYSILSSRILLNIIISIAQTIIIIAVAVYGFKVKIVGDFLLFSLFLLLGTFTFIAVGFLISAIAKTSETASSMATVITMPMMFLGDVFLPIKMFPAYIQIIAKVMPLTYFSNGLRKIMIYNSGIGDILLDIFLILVLGVISFAIAIKMFRWE